MRAEEALERLGGVASAGDLIRATSRRRVRTALRHDRIRRAGRGRYVLPAGDQARRAAAMCNGVATHLSAALLHGWAVRDPPERPQIAIPRGRPLPKSLACEVSRVDPRAVVEGWATSPVSTVLLCARDLPFPDALSVADSALRDGAVTCEALTSAAGSYFGAARRRIDQVLAHADARAANPFESSLRALVIEAGLAMVPQYEVCVLGLVFHPDLVDPINGLVVEAESWEFHGKERADFDRDVERYTALAVTGWRVLRFTWTEVMHRPDHVLRCLRAVKGPLDA